VQVIPKLERNNINQRTDYVAR